MGIERGKVSGQLDMEVRLNFLARVAERRQETGQALGVGGKKVRHTTVCYYQYTSSLGFQSNIEKRKNLRFSQS